MRNRTIDTFDPTNHICRTYLCSNETAHSVTNPDNWFPMAIVPMNHKGIIYGTLMMTGTEIKVCTLLETGATKP